MNKRFLQYVKPLEKSFRSLTKMKPVKVTTLPSPMPKSGIYLFSEGKRHLYVGRARDIRKRLHLHCRPSSGHYSATFAFRLARKKTGRIKATYTPRGSQADLLKNRGFNKAFREAKERIRKMHVRYVAEDDPLRQALLEIYASVVLRTPHNHFETH